MLHDWEGLDEAVAVAQTGTFVGGARRLGVSTSHISRAISKLENKLGTILFVRTTRKVSLTATGRNFVERCQSIIQSRDEILAYAGGSIEPQGELRITCSVTLGERFVAPILMQYQNMFPRVDVALHLDNSVVDLVGEGFDLAVRTGNVTDSRLIGEQIAMRSLVVCAAPKYLQQRGAPVSPGDLSAHDCLVGTATTWLFNNGQNDSRVTPNRRWHCNNGNVIVEASLRGLGICQLPQFYVQDHIATGRLVPVLHKFAPRPEPVWAVYEEKRILPPKVKQLVELLRVKLPEFMAPTCRAQR